MMVSKSAINVRGPTFPTRDHIFPHSLGGISTIIVCNDCNGKKGDKTPTEWLAHVIAEMPHRADAIRAIFRRFRLIWKEPV